jgi:polar amino acid transport system substrate-binding protein
MMKLLRLLIGAVFLAIGCGAAAQTATLRVATRVVKPFVYQDHGALTGFSIELWQEIARELKVTTQFEIKNDVNEALAAVQSDQADLAIAAISITAEREMQVDFSQPMFDAGLQIMTPMQPSGHRSVLTAIVAGIFSADMLLFLGTIALIVLIPAHLVWFSERRHPSGMFSSRSYLPGILEACWWSASTLATQADQMPRSAWARIVAVIWMFASVVFIAYFTATVTSNLTLQQLRSDINGPEDLAGKRVVSVHGSTSFEYLQQHNIDAKEFFNFEDAARAIEDHQADALVYDAPALMYYATHEGRGKVQVVGAIFRRENYGIVVRNASPLLKQVNTALLTIKENGTYDRLYSKWFGASAGT